MALILILNATDRTTLATSVHGFTDSPNGFHTGSDTGTTGLATNTELPCAIERDSSLTVTQEIHLPPGSATSISAGSLEPTTIRLRNRPGLAGTDILSGLDGKSVEGHDAQLIETGELDGSTYTLTSPYTHRSGIVQKEGPAVAHRDDNGFNTTCSERLGRVVSILMSANRAANQKLHFGPIGNA